MENCLYNNMKRLYKKQTINITMARNVYFIYFTDEIGQNKRNNSHIVRHSYLCQTLKLLR